MKCLLCLKPMSRKSKIRINKYLQHIVDKWDICYHCDRELELIAETERKIYYLEHKGNYRKLHKKYKAKLIDSYVANAFVERSELKAVDVPKAIIKAKRQSMLMNRIIKESKNGG